MTKSKELVVTLMDVRTVGPRSIRDNFPNSVVLKATKIRTQTRRLIITNAGPVILESGQAVVANYGPVSIAFSVTTDRLFTRTRIVSLKQSDGMQFSS